MPILNELNKKEKKRRSGRGRKSKAFQASNLHTGSEARPAGWREESCDHWSSRSGGRDQRETEGISIPCGVFVFVEEIELYL